MSFSSRRHFQALIDGLSVFTPSITSATYLPITGRYLKACPLPAVATIKPSLLALRPTSNWYTTLMTVGLSDGVCVLGPTVPYFKPPMFVSREAIQATFGSITHFVLPAWESFWSQTIPQCRIAWNPIDGD
ncbi:hypothetical protein KC360_g72 [Hortaea werneckii]|nr:hypothetical protein KC360_g72 [Hortaea werneckii]